MLRAKEQAEAAKAELHDSYAEFEEANRHLLELDQLKSDFLSSVSHELRTPLTSIRGFVTLIAREFSRSFTAARRRRRQLQRSPSASATTWKIMLKESVRLTRLINDVLDLAKIEAGRVEWHDAPSGPRSSSRCRQRRARHVRLKARCEPCAWTFRKSCHPSSATATA